MLEAFSVSHGKAHAYLPLVDLLKSYFRITLEDNERRRREKIGGKVLMLDRTLEDTLPYLFSLLGIGDEAASLAHGSIFTLPYDWNEDSDRFRAWESEIHTMRTALDLWEAADQDDSKKLSQLVKIQDGSIERLHEDVERVLRRHLPLKGRTPTPEDWIKYRNAFGGIRRGQSGSRQIAIEIVGGLATLRNIRTHLVFRRASSGTSFESFMQPRRLIDALWLQLGQLLTRDSRLIVCPGCNQPSLIAAKQSRSDRVHCSEACRQQAHRLRERVRKLRRQRVPIKAIAKKLGRNEGMVRGWIRQ